MKKNAALYLLALLAALGIAAALLYAGHLVHPDGAAPIAGPREGFWLRLREPLGLLLVQIVVILAAARTAGVLIRRVGQPAVMGEILAGILLGPSLLGWLSPDLLAALFPRESLAPLQLLSQVGVLLFMFAVGLDVDLQQQAPRARVALIVSHAGTAIPFLLGIVLAAACYRTLAPEGVGFVPFALFLGIAMSVTAFPVLARILQERRLSRTPLGQTAIGCAAIGDVLAWCLLAVVISIVNAAGIADAALTIVLAALFAAGMLLGVRPLLQRAIDRWFQPVGDNAVLVAGMLIFAFACAAFTEAIGIHALFGAFLAGVLVGSRPRFRHYLHDRVQPLAALILLPLFFAFVGLRTSVGLLDDPRDWVLCLALIAVAVAGKLGGSALAARWAGQPWPDALALGVLMNTRGLMELVVLNIGYELGILSARAFAMLVIMALVTTLMTGPLLGLLGTGRRAAPQATAST